MIRTPILKIEALKRIIYGIVFCLSLSVSSAAQDWITQKSKAGFCGFALDSADLPFYSKEVAFLRLAEGDTLVDIGASSGWFEGVIACVLPVQKLHFVLVDVDSNCLNEQTVKRMTHHYSNLKGSAINYTYQIKINTPKSLSLRAEMSAKFLLRNTLHEVKHTNLFIKQLYDACRKYGQVIIIELVPAKKGERHKGCNELMLGTSAITKLFEKNGFALVEKTIDASTEVKMQFLRFAKL